MSFRVYGEKLMTADMSGIPRMFCRFILPTNRNIRAFRTWVVYYNNPSFTALFLDIYSKRPSNNNSSPNIFPGTKLFRSDKSWAPADISNQAYAVKELYFDFNEPIALRADTYCAVLYASGYTGTDASHIAWRRGWPDPNISNITATMSNLTIIPPHFGVIDELRN